VGETRLQLAKKQELLRSAILGCYCGLEGVYMLSVLRGD
jgi:hypothetical protein